MIVTTAPDGPPAPLDDGMAFILDSAKLAAVLGEAPADAERFKASLVAYAAHDVVIRPVSPRIGNVKNNDRSLIEPIAPSQS